jgi:hypothetical protein
MCGGLSRGGHDRLGQEVSGPTFLSCVVEGGGEGGNRMSLHTRSKIHERTISLRFLGIILRVLILEVFRIQCLRYKPEFQTTSAQGGVKSVSRGDCK